MTSTHEEAIFIAALDCSDGQSQSAYLDEACAGDCALRRRMDLLLSAYGDGQFLEVPAAGLTATATMSPISEKPGAEIGPYKLLEQIGEGGMGLVFMAEQTRPLRRRVALKIIKPGMDTQAVVARFEAERQALALMDHANIARVFDAGATESGRPYFVMELVRGVPITDYCHKRGLELRERLELFIEVCQAVQHAHQKGIIHRDLKPTNILVAHDDTKPLPKIIDFGVAKATTQPLIDRTLFTAFAQIIGTPLYMSPEQAELNYQDVDTRSDIYSLGVVLYELLTGTTPFDKDRLRSVGPDEMRRIIREEEPPKPSTRATMILAATTVASQGSERVPKIIAPALQGDLDWIVMKALEKDRRRRYETVSGLAADLRRYLNDEPVEACPPSKRYRFAKFARRNRAALTTAALVAGTLVVGAGVSLWQAIRATQAEQRSAAAFDSAQERLVLARSVVDEMYTAVAVKWLSREGPLTPLQKSFLEKARQFYEQFALQPAHDNEGQLEALRARFRVGLVEEELENFDSAIVAYSGAIVRLETLVHRLPDDLRFAEELAHASNRMGQLQYIYGNLDEAEALLERAVELQTRLLSAEPDHRERRLNFARMSIPLANVYLDQAKYDEAETALRQSLDQLSMMQSHDPMNQIAESLASAKDHLGDLYVYMGRYEDAAGAKRDALQVWEKLLALDPQNAELRHSVARLSGGLASVVQGEEKHLVGRRAVELLDDLIAEFPDRASYRSTFVTCVIPYSDCLDARGQADESEAVLRKGVATAEKLIADSPDIPDYRNSLACVLSILGQRLKLSGKDEESRQASAQAVELIDGLIAEFPDQPNFRKLRDLHEYKMADVPEADAARHREEYLRLWKEHAVRHLKAEPKQPRAAPTPNSAPPTKTGVPTASTGDGRN